MRTVIGKGKSERAIKKKEEKEKKIFHSLVRHDHHGEYLNKLKGMDEMTPTVEAGRGQICLVKINNNLNKPTTRPAMAPAGGLF